MKLYGMAEFVVDENTPYYMFEWNGKTYAIYGRWGMRDYIFFGHYEYEVEYFPNYVDVSKIKIEPHKRYYFETEYQCVYENPLGMKLLDFVYSFCDPSQHSDCKRDFDRDVKFITFLPSEIKDKLTPAPSTLYTRPYVLNLLYFKDIDTDIAAAIQSAMPVMGSDVANVNYYVWAEVLKQMGYGEHIIG